MTCLGDNADGQTGENRDWQDARGLRTTEGDNDYPMVHTASCPANYRRPPVGLDKLVEEERKVK